MTDTPKADSKVVALRTPQLSEGQIALVRKTVAKDLEPPEFDHFMHQARGWGLDPMRKQLYAIVYNKDKPDKRKVTYVTGIDGYRTIADRTGCYRPGQRSVEISQDAVDPRTNPYGIISATAEVHKYAQGEWHSFSETVYWEEFAPLREIWAYDKTEGRKKPTGKFELDRSGNWAKMGRVMLGKCAEAQAIRRGWPDEVSGLSTSEEMDAANIIDLTATEIVEDVERKNREAAVGGHKLAIDWLDESPLSAVKPEELYGLAQDYIRKNAEKPHDIIAWFERNRVSLKEFFVHKPDEALELKKTFETYRGLAEKLGSEGLV